MNLREAAMNISKDWREIILKLLDSYPLIEDSYKKESSNFNKIYPKVKDIFNCFNYFNLNETKVVILGQDPYHGEGQANGLAFAVNNNIKVPPSLKNILKKIDNTEHDKTLVKWAKQGVLLLNASLTVVQGKPNSNINLWNNYTIELINELNKLDGIVFVAWGAFAYNKIRNIDITRHKIIVSSHPSPLSFKKNMGTYPSFYGSSPFSKINNYLLELGYEEIDW